MITEKAQIFIMAKKSFLKIKKTEKINERMIRKIFGHKVYR